MSKMTNTTRMTTTILGATLAAALVALSLGAAQAETPASLSEELGVNNAIGFIDETGAQCYVIELEDGQLPGMDGEAGQRLQVICGAGADTLIV
ncbi:MAG: hypothetical protein AAF495_20720 [Pseudomonadota bacterium]